MLLLVTCSSFISWGFNILVCDSQLNKIVCLPISSHRQQLNNHSYFLYFPVIFFKTNTTRCLRQPESYTLTLNMYIHCLFLYSFLPEAANTYCETPSVSCEVQCLLPVNAGQCWHSNTGWQQWVFSQQVEP